MMEYPSTTATLHATSSKSLGSLGHSSTELRALSTGGGGNASGWALETLFAASRHRRLSI